MKFCWLKHDANTAVTTNGTSTVPTSGSGRVPLSAAQMSTISTEESDSEIEPVARVDVDGGPFSSFADLKTRLAHLAVFLHYLLSNSDPASLVSFKSYPNCTTMFPTRVVLSSIIFSFPLLPISKLKHQNHGNFFCVFQNYKITSGIALRLYATLKCTLHCL